MYMSDYGNQAVHYGKGAPLRHAPPAPTGGAWGWKRFSGRSFIYANNSPEIVARATILLATGSKLCAVRSSQPALPSLLNSMMVFLRLSVRSTIGNGYPCVGGGW